MIFLPYERFTIQTSLTPDQVRQKLSNELETVSSVFRSSLTTKKTYRDIIDENKFEITPIVFYNHFTPVIKGDILAKMGCTQIRVTMSPRFYLAVFMAVWLGLHGCIFLLILAALMFPTETFSAPSGIDGLLYVGGFFVLGYLFLVGGFKSESIKSKECLRELLSANEKQR